MSLKYISTEKLSWNLVEQLETTTLDLIMASYKKCSDLFCSVLVTRGAVLHLSAKPAYGVELAPCDFSNLSCFRFSLQFGTFFNGILDEEVTHIILSRRPATLSHDPFILMALIGGNRNNVEALRTLSAAGKCKKYYFFF